MGSFAIRRAYAGCTQGAASIKARNKIESCYFNLRKSRSGRQAGGCNEYSLDHHNWVCAWVIAKLIYPGNKYEPTGYIWTTVLGIIGAFVATYLGQAVGWYQAGQNAGFIGAIVGAIIVLFVWGFIAPRFERS